LKKYFLLTTILYSSTLLASETSIKNMLENLRQKSELHHKTAQRDAGLVTIYSREDLDRMQAYTLKDILKSVPFVNYQEGLVGTSGISTATLPIRYMPNTRLYIDDHEVSSTYFGSAFYIYGNMNLGYVDHIEVYQGGNGVEFGSEPSVITVRVYTKTAHRENVSEVQLLADHRGSKSSYLYSGKKSNDLEYSLYISGEDINRDSVNYNSNELSKDSVKSHLLVNVKNKKFNLLLSRYDSLQDAFAGYGSKKNPTGTNEIDKYHQFVYANYNILDNLKAYVSVDDLSTKMGFHEESGYNGGASDYLNIKWKENIYKAGLKGVKSISSNDLKYGFEYAQKNLTPKVSRYNNLDTLNIQGPTKLDIYSFYLQDSYAVLKNGRLTATMKINHYSDNNQAKDRTLPIARVGYLHSFDNDYSAKIFLNHTYIYPSFFYTTTYSGKAHTNPRLKPTQLDILSAEFSKKIEKYNIRAGVVFTKSKNSIFLNPVTKQYDNFYKIFKIRNSYFEIKYKFDLFNSLYLNIYEAKNSEHVEYSSENGATLRVLNKYDKFDFFNELIYKSNYLSQSNVKVDSGFDYSLGISYESSNRLSFNIKGENIFNKSIEVPITKIGNIQSIDRRFLVGMEYLF